MSSKFSAHWSVRIGAVMGATTLLVALSACGQAKQDPQSAQQAEPAAVSVGVVQVQAQPVQQWDSFNGRISAQESVDIRSRVNGYIERINFREGEWVRKGQLLFAIDARPYQAALANAQAQLQRDRAAAALAKTQDQRASELLKSRAISAEEADNRASAWLQAEANVRAAQAAVTAAQLELGFTEVRSPINGMTGRAMLTAGNLAQANQSLLTTVVSHNPVFVYFDADEQSLRHSRQAHEPVVQAVSAVHASEAQPTASSMPVPVRVGLSGDDGFPHQAVLSFTDNQLDPQTGTIRLRATLNNDQGLLIPGMFARVQMQAQPSYHAVLIDDKAVLTDQDRQYAYVVGPEQRAQRRELKLGRMVQGRRLVESGLQPGDQLVVLGLQRIHYPGMPLAPRLVNEEDTPALPGVEAAAVSPQS